MLAWLFLLMPMPEVGGLGISAANCESRCEPDRIGCAEACKRDHEDDGAYGDCIDQCTSTKRSCVSTCGDCSADCRGAAQKCADACPDDSVFCCAACDSQWADCFRGKCGVDPVSVCIKE